MNLIHSRLASKDVKTCRGKNYVASLLFLHLVMLTNLVGFKRKVDKFAKHKAISVYQLLSLFYLHSQMQ